VFVDVQRGGPSTGLPTLPGQADMMQVKWGSHGDYEPIAICPNSPQECFDLMIKAFNLAEQYRVPVFFMMDEVVGHMTERVVIPPADQIEVKERRWTTKKPGEYKPYEAGADGVPEMVKAGDGYRIHITGLTHDERGYPSMTIETQQILVRRLVDKIQKNVDKIIRIEEEQTSGADVVVVSYGITSRVAQLGVELARQQGAKVGTLRLVVCWPFPEARIRELGRGIRAFVVPEINFGQMSLEVERCAAGRAATIGVPHAGGGVHDPELVCQAILGAAR
jgi:2-oxoglutarate ferredoxin oxidoreductase subunit alpha